MDTVLMLALTIAQVTVVEKHRAAALLVLGFGRVAATAAALGMMIRWVVKATAQQQAAVAALDIFARKQLWVPAVIVSVQKNVAASTIQKEESLRIWAAPAAAVAQNFNVAILKMDEFLVLEACVCLDSGIMVLVVGADMIMKKDVTLDLLGGTPVANKIEASSKTTALHQEHICGTIFIICAAAEVKEITLLNMVAIVGVAVGIKVTG